MRRSGAAWRTGGGHHGHPAARRLDVLMPASSAPFLQRTLSTRAAEGWTIERRRGDGTVVTGKEEEEEIRVVRMASNAVNCINPAFLDHLNSTLDVLERENASHPTPVVFTSASEKTYCAGLDLKTVSAMSRDELTRFIHRLNESYVRLLSLGCPTVAAINGHAIAGGALLALSADYRVGVASAQSWFGVNEVRLGIPFPSGPWAVMRYIAATRPRFNELILSGELVRLDTAHREYGLVDHTVSSAADLTQGSIDYVRGVVHRHSLRAFVAVKSTAQRPCLELYRREKGEGEVDRTFVDIFFSDDARRAIGQRLAGLKS